MKALAVRVVAPTASFRRPLEHTYQRTLPLPPPTTLVGLAGAALGLDTAQLWGRSSPIQGLRVQVLAECRPAYATDMWTLLKIKAGKVERSPYRRELLFGAHLTLLYSAESETLNQLQEAFRQPAYPLCLGREDELLQIMSCEIKDCRMSSRPYIFHGTILPGDLRMLKARPVLEEGTILEPATVEHLPTHFEIGRNNTRQPSNRQVFTFLPFQTKIEVEQISQEVYQYCDRNFVWVEIKGGA